MVEEPLWSPNAFNPERDRRQGKMIQQNENKGNKLMQVASELQNLPFRQMLDLAGKFNKALAQKGSTSDASVAEALLEAAEQIKPVDTQSATNAAITRSSR